jgi:hypothetical protein
MFNFVGNKVLMLIEQVTALLKKLFSQEKAEQELHETARSAFS